MIFFILISSLLSPVLGRTEENVVPKDHHPVPCLGFNPELQQWGPHLIYETEICPQGYAYTSADDPPGGVSDPLEPVNDPCCKLPAEDILLPIRFVASQFCPDDAIVVGSLLSRSKAPFSGYAVLCQFINSSRYTLSAPENGVYWGVGSQTLLSLFDARQVVWRELPVAMRYSVGRRGMTFWDSDGCVSDPPGALLVGKTRGTCAATLFRRLLFRGAAGDPPAGTPVTIFPNPKTLSDIFDESSTTPAR